MSRRKEILLGERIVGFKHWRYTAYGAQALDMMAAFRDDLDEGILTRYLERIDPRGMTRPTRSPEERAWLEQRGEASVFVEVEPVNRD
jgi:hypothetical protein